MNEQKLANENCIYRCVAGSRAYGTNLPGSDFDVRGVFIAPPEYVIGCLKAIEQVKLPEEDTVIYELAKFVKLAVACSPNIIELLFTGEENILFIDPAFAKLREHRHLFLSKKAKFTFSGYAMAQMKRIRGHHRWIQNPQPERAPDLLDFATFILRSGIVTDGAAVESLVLWRHIFLVKVNATVFRVYSSRNFRKSILSADRQNIQYVESLGDGGAAKNQFEGTLIVQQDTYRVQHRMWKDYWQWKKNRNPARAELEEKYGFDCKHDTGHFPAGCDLSKRFWFFSRVG